MPTESTFLCGPVPACWPRPAGPWVGSASVTTRTAPPPLNIDYLKGLNFLLNEQTDQALEHFLRMVRVDDKTIETHFALGSLFRRRGEVDRAIRIHQNIIARPDLAAEQRDQALYSLAKDYSRRRIARPGGKAVLSPGARVALPGAGTGALVRHL